MELLADTVSSIYQLNHNFTKAERARTFCMLLAELPVELLRTRTKDGESDNEGAKGSSESSEDIARREYQTPRQQGGEERSVEV